MPKPPSRPQRASPLSLRRCAGTSAPDEAEAGRSCRRRALRLAAWRATFTIGWPARATEARRALEHLDELLGAVRAREQRRHPQLALGRAARRRRRRPRPRGRTRRAARPRRAAAPRRPTARGAPAIQLQGALGVALLEERLDEDVRAVEVGLAVARGRQLAQPSGRNARGPTEVPVARSASASRIARSRSSRPPRISGEPPAIDLDRGGAVALGQQHRGGPEPRREQAREEGRLLPAPDHEPRRRRRPGAGRAQLARQARLPPSGASRRRAPRRRRTKPAMRLANDASPRSECVNVTYACDRGDEARRQRDGPRRPSVPQVATRRIEARSDHAL